MSKERISAVLKEWFFVLGISKNKPPEEFDASHLDDDSTLQPWSNEEPAPRVTRLPTAQDKLNMPNHVIPLAPHRPQAPTPPSFAPHNTPNIPPTGTVEVLHRAERPAPPKVTKADTAVVMNPESYQDCELICEHYKADRPVVVNLQACPKGLNMRILDFISGLACAKNGKLTLTVHNVFLLCPPNVELSTNAMQRLRERGMVE